MGDFHFALQLVASPAANRTTSRPQIAPIEFAPCWPPIVPGAGSTWAYKHDFASNGNAVTI